MNMWWVTQSSIGPPTKIIYLFLKTWMNHEHSLNIFKIDFFPYGICYFQLLSLCLLYFFQMIFEYGTCCFRYCWTEQLLLLTMFLPISIKTKVFEVIQFEFFIFFLDICEWTVMSMRIMVHNDIRQVLTSLH